MNIFIFIITSMAIALKTIDKIIITRKPKGLSASGIPDAYTFIP